MAELLIDEGIGQDLAQLLRAQGLPAFHALEFLPKGSSDALVFLEAQTRALTIFTWNRDDYALLAEAWRYWGHGAHHGVISRPIGQRQLPRAETYRVLEQYCRDGASFVDRIELF
jgi:Domain of unknown function (DUF5615)